MDGMIRHSKHDRLVSEHLEITRVRELQSCNIFSHAQRSEKAVNRYPVTRRELMQLLQMA
jgi:hypothetical protein